MRATKERTWRRLTGRLAAVGMVVGGVLAVSTSTASAAGPYFCQDGNHEGDYCAKVTAINPGSYLAFHKGPNYTSGTIAGVRLANGTPVSLVCWTTGAGDIDGHGDTYWFKVDTGAVQGYVNDWYLTTGSPSQWHPFVPYHC
ncbi:hypothetical protein [Streptomyces sp. NBC_01198]|uniref:hypothetical protein n=1 Tax=Streptomyces sp. NBC_01198 TaxID=2903769 RepID=UPI002E0E8972|nr:hypothetical protein OG702_00430 [Streptomyces sp. NBC_01198]